MQNIDKMLEVLHVPRDLSHPDEVAEAEQIIRYTSQLDAAARDTLVALFKKGPLYDGDVPSKSGRNTLLAFGFATKIVMNGEDGYSACTYDGRDAYRLLESGLLNDNPT